jgi:hypothetical protein
MERSRDDRTWKTHLPVLLIALVLIAFPVLYVGSYYALVERDPLATFQFAGSTEEYYDAKYAVADETAQTFFRAMHLFDVWLRPEHWRSPTFIEIAE